ncbi:hypothetical protein R1A27_22180 [Methylobacterium sp. NMS12]|uniref:hypothetical protein n=1 Tax=Methylobacterium sp. NMS12 TaxID=3079766 RepID=UPI003F882A1B
MRKSNTARAVEPTSDLRQRAARARDAAGRFIKRPAPAERTAADPDPALAAIEAHRCAFEEYEQLASVANDLPSADPGYRAAALAAEELGKREIATYQALFEAKPATLASTASLAAYMCDAVRTAQIDDKPSDGERALRTIADALHGLGPAADASLHPDAALFALGYQFISAWVSEEAIGNEAAYRECTLEAERIAQTPAMTVAGLGIKALLLARLDSEDSGPSKPITARGPLASHWNVLRQIQEGAAQLAAAPDFGIPMSAAADPETGFPVTDPAPAVEGLVGLLDLASATVDELQAIQSMAEHVGAVAYAYAWSPRCDRRSKRGSFPDFNDAGKLMRWLGDALTDVESAVDREVASRRPGNRLDRETRLSMRAVTLIENGDPDTIKAFALELLDHATAEARGY